MAALLGGVVALLALKVKTWIGLELSAEQQEVLTAWLVSTIYSVLHNGTPKSS